MAIRVLCGANKVVLIIRKYQMITANEHIKASLRGLFLHAIKFIMFKIQIIFFQARRLGLLSKKYNYDSVVQR